MTSYPLGESMQNKTPQANLSHYLGCDRGFEALV
jgi:hypothetical protein